MAAMLKLISDEIKEQLDDATLSMTPEAIHQEYLPLYDRTKLSGLHLFVAQVDQERTNDGTRQDDEFRYTLAIGIYKEVDPTDSNALDGLQAYTEEIIDLLRSDALRTLTLDEGSTVTLDGCFNKPAYDKDQLDQNHVYVSAIGLEYFTFR